MMLGNFANHLEKIKLDFYLTQYIEINSRWIKESKCKTENYKILEENMECVFSIAEWEISLKERCESQKL